MATNKQGQRNSTLARELESIRDSLSVPTQIPLLKDIVNTRPQAANTRQATTAGSPNKSTGNKNPQQANSKSQTPRLALDAATQKKIRAASDKIIEELSQEYAKRINAFLRKELGAKLEKLLADMNTGSDKNS